MGVYQRLRSQRMFLLLPFQSVESAFCRMGGNFNNVVKLGLLDIFNGIFGLNIIQKSLVLHEWKLSKCSLKTAYL